MTPALYQSLPEDPPGFHVRTEAQKATFERGFRLERRLHRDAWEALVLRRR